ncbi:MAG: hypothetical protein ACI9VS_000863 [Candidatus Binatia bacterium]|jgi:hypothetical protein
MNHSLLSFLSRKLRAVFSLTIAFAVSSVGAQELKPLIGEGGVAAWVKRGGNADYNFSDGTLVGTTVPGSPNTFLCPPQDYGDFVLEYESKIDSRLNAGVQVRSHQFTEDAEVFTLRDGKLSRRKKKAGTIYGYQIEMDPSDRAWSAGIYDESRHGWIADLSQNEKAQNAFRKDDWNQFRVEARGDRIRTWINGVAAADLRDSADLSGFIGFQVHSFRGKTPATVRWRNIRLADFGSHNWSRLWDGETMNGWKLLGGGKAEIEAGAIHLTNVKSERKHGLLYFDRELGDATVRLKFKCVAGNSGFYVRSELRPEHPVGIAGFQAEIDPIDNVGGLYETLGRAWVVPTGLNSEMEFLRANAWNEMTVSAHGRRLVVHVNGVRTAELKNDPGRLKGFLAMQVHGGQDVDVWFKDIEILQKASK